MVSEEVAEANTLANLPQVAWWRPFAKYLKLFSSRKNAFRCEDDTQIGYFGVTKEAFCRTDLELVLFEFGEDLIQHLQVMLMGGGVDGDVIDVDNNAVDAIEELFHDSLKRGGIS